jgi:hypothetical protein
MITRLRDACPGLILTTIGVVVFAVTFSHGDDPVNVWSSLLWGSIAVVLVRLVLGVLSSGNTILTVAGIAFAVFEMAVLVRAEPSNSFNSFSELGFVILGLLDIGVTATVWVVVLIARRGTGNIA